MALAKGALDLIDGRPVPLVDQVDWHPPPLDPSEAAAAGFLGPLPAGPELDVVGVRCHVERSADECAASRGRTVTRTRNCQNEHRVVSIGHGTTPALGRGSGVQFGFDVTQLMVAFASREHTLDGGGSVAHLVTNYRLVVDAIGSDLG